MIPDLRDIETPALLLDLDCVERNMAKMARFFSRGPITLRPHFKNHRVLALASRQIELGAIGVTCAHIWQAEKLASHGIRNLLIANEVFGPSPMNRLTDLAQRVPVTIAVDNVAAIAEMAIAARNRKVNLGVVVDVDIGLHRCGAQPGRAAVELARAACSHGLRFAGIMGYEGHLQPLPPGPEKEAAVKKALRALVRTKRLIESAGIAVGIVSCGGTGDYSIAGSYNGVTEIQAGSYLLMDSWYAPFARDFEQALTVLATIISTTPGSHIVVDAGVKAISGERGLPVLKKFPQLKLKALHAEHALIEMLDQAVEVKVGDRLEIQVQYHDGTVNLHRRMYGIRKGAIEKIFTIEHN